MQINSNWRPTSIVADTLKTIKTLAGSTFKRALKSPVAFSGPAPCLFVRREMATLLLLFFTLIVTSYIVVTPAQGPNPPEARF